jgi:uncharacterized protein
LSDHLDSRAERLAVALDDFIHSSPDVEAAAVVSFDGLPMASALPDDLEEDRVGAMSAALLSLGEQAALGLGRGQLNQVFVEGEHGFVFLMSARDQAVLSVIASRTAKIGFMLFEIRRAADRIGRALETPVAATPLLTDLLEDHSAPTVAPPHPDAPPNPDVLSPPDETPLAEHEDLGVAMWEAAREAHDPEHPLAGVGVGHHQEHDHTSNHHGPGSFYGDRPDVPPASPDAWSV